MLINCKLIFLLFPALCVLFSCNSTSRRQVLSLNGEWEIAKTDTFATFPSVFESTVPVPGLVDMAIPVLDTGKNYDGVVYWYRTNFTIEKNYPEVVRLVIGKAQYHTQVYLNDQFVGTHAYCFTPARFDVRQYMNPPGEENELLIGIGGLNHVSDTVIWGQDFEKLTYIPGIYDNVELILSGFPFIENIQVVPMIDEEKVRIVAGTDDGGKNTRVELTYAIRELASGKVVAQGKVKTNDFTVSIPDCQLWTPESPFLYELKLSTAADEQSVRFGMRSFTFDTQHKRAMLNGKPYFMRGTNVCIFRFFEDPDRGTLPWDDKWVIKLHEQFKSMQWNSIRYCIGLPPARWYEVADSLGFLIQNEYPVWTSVAGGFEKIYPKVTAEHLANEYRTWLPEHWNHPSVVIWDAQNESVTHIIGEAIGMVREMDLSDRPWENGWSEPGLSTDPIESHPYRFSRYRTDKEPPEGYKKYIFGKASRPDNDAAYHSLSTKGTGEVFPNPVIINEYGWIWLNRDGSPTTLTDNVYETLWKGSELTSQQRLTIYARHLAMLTEYWRAHRQVAGVLHFCGLGYSRPEEPRGQTSDHWTDIKNLTFEPEFYKYVKPSFAPVGLMIDVWEKSYSVGSKLEVPVFITNDLDVTFDREITLSLLRDDLMVSVQQKEVSVKAYDADVITFNLDLPDVSGDYQLKAEYTAENGESVFSLRDIPVK